MNPLLLELPNFLFEFSSERAPESRYCRKYNQYVAHSSALRELQTFLVLDDSAQGWDSSLGP